ncbi:MAG: hypothetical protein ACREPF_06975 [Rhodanobacteraceae bacterium]
MPKSDVTPFSVIASLTAGPHGTVRVSYSFPFRKALAALFRRFRPSVSRLTDYPPCVLEIDRAKLHRLQFSQQELAGIGFSLVAHLAVLDAYRVQVERTSSAA